MPAEHGTTAGYHRHKRHDEQPCPDCLTALREYSRQRRNGTTPPRDLVANAVIDYLTTYGETDTDLLLDRMRERRPGLTLSAVTKSLRVLVAKDLVERLERPLSWGYKARPTYRIKGGV